MRLAALATALITLLAAAGTAGAQQVRVLAPATVSVTNGAGGTSVAAANTSRDFLILQNISDSQLFCAFGATPTTTSAHFGLAAATVAGKADGGSILLDTKYSTQQIKCIAADAGGKNVLVTEGVKSP